MTIDVALRLREPGGERGRLAEVAAQPDDAHVVAAPRAAASSAANVPSVEPSSTKIASQLGSTGSSAADSSSWSSATLRSSL